MHIKQFPFFALFPKLEIHHAAACFERVIGVAHPAERHRATLDANNAVARQMALDLAHVDPSIRPSEIGSPWALPGAVYFTDAEHQNHLHVGFDAPIQANWQPPADAAAAPVTPVAPAAASADVAAPSSDDSSGDDSSGDDSSGDDSSGDDSGDDSSDSQEDPVGADGESGGDSDSDGGASDSSCRSTTSVGCRNEPARRRRVRRLPRTKRRRCRA